MAVRSVPDFAANEFAPISKVFSVIAAKIRSDIPAADISGVMDDVSSLLDYSIATQGYIIKPSATAANYIDLSQIDFDAFRARFDKGRKQKLRGSIAQKLAREPEVVNALRSLRRIQKNRPRAQVALRNASKQLKAVLDRWETAYNKENFYRGIRILLELQRQGSSKL